MNEETNQSPSRAEARAVLADIDQIIFQTRRAIAQGPAGPLLILWGCIWAAADLSIQFYPPSVQWIWLVVVAIGAIISTYLGKRHGVQVKQPGRWRYGAFWLVLFGYATLWIFLLMSGSQAQLSGSWDKVEPTYRKVAAYWHTVPMFAYVVVGMWLGRFFVWLGLLVTALIIAGLYLAPHYYSLWLAVAGGGSLIVSGVFINKFWK